jgi:hypothetical protein
MQGVILMQIFRFAVFQKSIALRKNKTPTITESAIKGSNSVFSNIFSPVFPLYVSFFLEMVEGVNKASRIHNRNIFAPCFNSCNPGSARLTSRGAQLEWLRSSL